MKYLFIVFLLLNVIYLGYEIDRETRLLTSSRIIPAVAKASELDLLTQAQRKTLQRKLSLPEAEDRQSNSERSDEDLADEANDDDGIVALMTPDVAIEAIDSDSKLLQMLDIDSSMKVATSVSISTAPICFSFGPFNQSSSAEGLLEWLLANEIVHAERWTYEGDKELFWVYLAPVAERSQALATLEQLENQGVEDFRLIRKGSFKNAISLGLFSTQARVNRRLRDLNSKGYQPVVVPYGMDDSKKLLWVDIEITGELFQQNQSFLATFNSTGVDCSEIDMAAAKP